MSFANLKSSRMLVAFVAAMVVLTVAWAAVPAQAQTPTTVYAFPGQPGPYNPNIEAIAQGRDGNLYLTSAGGNGGAANLTHTHCREAVYIAPPRTVTNDVDFHKNHRSFHYYPHVLSRCH